MLRLENIKKEYKSADYTVHALKGINLQFREKEFVAILGPSGCGKTTLLNIIGGLDQYSSGDLRINGKSTKEYKDKDWDQYRNHSIGFVFQSYNLIPHQNVLSNVSLAARIADKSLSASQEKAKKALESVGLGQELQKKPNQISGGQSQRVAISRALVTDPDIILADEPTGALDSVSSKQVMDILKEISKEKLVIMVTHDAELAEKYADRIIRMKDGEVIDDTKVLEESSMQPVNHESRKKAKMKWATAFRLSLNNLWSKKGRTILTALAGSIGIIGIALIFALSNGIQQYIDQVQEDTLSAYPIEIERETIDASALMRNLMERENEDKALTEKEEVYTQDIMYDFLQGMSQSSTIQNNMEKFADFLEADQRIQDLASIVHYSYAIDLPVYTKAKNDEVQKVDIMEVMSAAFETDQYQNQMMTQFSMAGSVDLFEELIQGANGELISEMYKEQYDLLEGKWPEKENEIVLVLDQKNRVADLTYYALGLRDREELSRMMEAVLQGEEIEREEAEEVYSFDDFMNLELKLILANEAYQKNDSLDIWVNMFDTESGSSLLYDSTDIGMQLKVVGILRENPESSVHAIEGSFAYTSALTDSVLEKTNTADVVKEQIANEEMDIFTNLPFMTADWQEPSDKEKEEAFQDYSQEQDPMILANYYTWIMAEPSDEEVNTFVEEQMQEMTRENIEEELAEVYAQQMQLELEQVQGFLKDMSDEELFSTVETMLKERYKEQYRQRTSVELSQMDEETKASLYQESEWNEEQYRKLYDQFMPPTVSEASYEENLDALAWADPEVPDTIAIYSNSFRDKDAIAEVITSYNEEQTEEDQIQYTDFIALLMSSITSIISGISYVLIAFVAISLIVSSVMIGIITYISVIERTKEIGILRALGASKKNVSTVFNAETIVEGFVAGVLGIGISLLLLIPINHLVQKLTEIENLQASLPWQVALALIAISILLTLVAGFIPSRYAAKLNPVEALRTE